MQLQVDLRLNAASFSDCERYRYALWRTWDTRRVRLCWIMLNPSTAGTHEDDPTIRKCIGFSRRWGCGGIYVVNLFAWRATNPNELLKVEDPVGFENDAAIGKGVFSCQRNVMLAWGKVHPALISRSTEVMDELFRNGVAPRCLGKNQGGTPKHPLYIPYSQEAIEYER